MAEPPVKSAFIDHYVTAAQREQSFVRRGEDTVPGEKSNQAFDDLLKTQLAQHGGVFLGEDHYQSHTRQRTTSFLPEGKTVDVTAVTYELPQAMLDNIQAAPDTVSVLKIYPGLGTIADSLWELSQQAKLHHIVLLGHENEAFTHQEKFARIGHLTPEEEENKKYRESLKGMNERDVWAAEYIRTRVPATESGKPGKVIVIGGSWHSKKKNDSVAAKAYPGLNVRLGFPAIDYLQTKDNPGIFLTTGDGSDYLFATNNKEIQEIRKKLLPFIPLPADLDTQPPAPPPDPKLSAPPPAPKIKTTGAKR